MIPIERMYTDGINLCAMLFCSITFSKSQDKMLPNTAKAVINPPKERIFHFFLVSSISVLVPNAVVKITFSTVTAASEARRV